MTWISTEKKPITVKPMEKLKALVNDLPKKIKAAREGIKKLKNGRI